MKDRRTSSRRRRFLNSVGIAVVAALTVVAVFVLSGPSLVGTWINDTPVFGGQFGAPPGQLRVQVNPDGTGLLLTDKQWIYKGFEYRVEHGYVVVRLGLPGEVQSKGEFTFEYSLANGRLSLTAADEETKESFPLIRFRKVAAQPEHKR